MKIVFGLNDCCVSFREKRDNEFLVTTESQIIILRIKQIGYENCIRLSILNSYWLDNIMNFLCTARPYQAQENDRDRKKLLCP